MGTTHVCGAYHELNQGKENLPASYIVLTNSFSYCPGNGKEPTVTVSMLKKDFDITLIFTTMTKLVSISFINHSRSLPSRHQTQKLIGKDHFIWVWGVGGKFSLYITCKSQNGHITG